MTHERGNPDPVVAAAQRLLDESAREDGFPKFNEADVLLVAERANEEASYREFVVARANELLDAFFAASVDLPAPCEVAITRLAEAIR